MKMPADLRLNQADRNGSYSGLKMLIKASDSRCRVPAWLTISNPEVTMARSNCGFQQAMDEASPWDADPKPEAMNPQPQIQNPKP